MPPVKYGSARSSQQSSDDGPVEDKSNRRSPWHQVFYVRYMYIISIFLNALVQ